MKKFISLVTAATLAAVFSHSYAKFVQTCDSAHIYNAMAENSPGQIKSNDVPRFTLVGKEGCFYLGIGANIKLIADFDWGHPLTDADDFVPSAIPASVDPGNGAKTQMSVGQSNFYLNFVGMPGTDNQLGIFIDINFLGASSKAVALHHAYLKYRGITAGYVVSTFTDSGAEPSAIDFAGPSAITFVRHPNISYTQKFGRNRLWTAALGLDLPDRATFTENSTVRMVNQRVPDIPLYIQRSWHQGKSWLRASAIFRDLYYRDLVADRNEGKLGWGVSLSGKSTVYGPLSAMWQGVYGKGVAGYIHDLGSLGLDLIPDHDARGKMQTVRTWGAYGTLRLDLSKTVFVNCTYSHVRAYTPFAAAENDTYKYGQYVTGNLFWTFHTFAQFGIEYLWGRRVNFNNDQFHDNRVMLMLSLSI